MYARTEAANITFLQSARFPQERFHMKRQRISKTISSIIHHLRWPQLNCKQWRKSRAPDDKWKLYNRWDQIHSLLSYNHGTSWQGYFKTDSGMTPFYGPYSLMGNIRNKKADSLTWIKTYLLFYFCFNNRIFSISQTKNIPVLKRSILFTQFRFLLLNLPHRTEGMFCKV